jgi:hypothetical protein
MGMMTMRRRRRRRKKKKDETGGWKNYTSTLTCLLFD